MSRSARMTIKLLDQSKVDLGYLVPGAVITLRDVAAQSVVGLYMFDEYALKV